MFICVFISTIPNGWINADLNWMMLILRMMRFPEALQVIDDHLCLFYFFCRIWIIFFCNQSKVFFAMDKVKMYFDGMPWNSHTSALRCACHISNMCVCVCVLCGRGWRGKIYCVSWNSLIYFRGNNNRINVKQLVYKRPIMKNHNHLPANQKKDDNERKWFCFVIKSFVLIVKN